MDVAGVAAFAVVVAAFTAGGDLRLQTLKKHRRYIS